MSVCLSRLSPSAGGVNLLAGALAFLILGGACRREPERLALPQFSERTILAGRGLAQPARAGQDGWSETINFDEMRARPTPTPRAVAAVARTVPAILEAMQIAHGGGAGRSAAFDSLHALGNPLVFAELISYLPAGSVPVPPQSGFKFNRVEAGLAAIH